jgi:hypothetical protein
MALDTDFKKVITSLPVAEKDKLLLRLIGKDPVLVEQLTFKLLEGGRTLNDRRAVVRQTIDRLADIKESSAGWVMMNMRAVSGDITRHVKVTNDKYGDVELNLHLLNAFCTQRAEQLRLFNPRSDKAALYLAKRAEQTLKKLAKLDPDYFIEFEREANQMLTHIHSLCSATYARQLALPRTWSANGR